MSIQSTAVVFATGTELRVCQDIAQRQDRGLRKYGVSVEANPLHLRQWLQHAYEETLDQAIYLRRAIDEMDALISPQAQSANGSVPPEHKKQGCDRDAPIRKFSELGPP